MSYLERKRALMIFDHHADLKYRFGNCQFFFGGGESYYASIVGLNESTIRKCICNQEKHDQAIDNWPR